MSDPLTPHAFYLVFAVALLWFPRQWLRSGVRVLKRRRKPDGVFEQLAGVGARDPADKSVQLGREFRTFRNHVDLMRSFVGSYGLMTYAFSGPGTGKVLAVQAAVLFVGLGIQAIRVDGGRFSFFAPIFYLVGLSVGFCQHYVGLFAFALVLAINPIIPNPRLFLTAFGVLLVPLGVLLGANSRLVLVAAAGVLAIPLASLLTKRPVVIFARKTKSPSRSSA